MTFSTRTVRAAARRIGDEHLHAAELTCLNTYSKGRSRPPIDPNRGVLDVRSSAPLLHRNIDGVRNLSGELVERQGRNEADDRTGHTAADGHQVRLLQRFTVRETVETATDLLEEPQGNTQAPERGRCGNWHYCK